MELQWSGNVAVCVSAGVRACVRAWHSNSKRRSIINLSITNYLK